MKSTSLPVSLLVASLVGCADASLDGACVSNAECDEDWEVCAAEGPKDQESCARESFGHCRESFWCGPLCVFGDAIGRDDEPSRRVYTNSCDSFGDASVRDSGLHADASSDAGAEDAGRRD